MSIDMVDYPLLVDDLLIKQRDINSRRLLEAIGISIEPPHPEDFDPDLYDPDQDTEDDE